MRFYLYLLTFMIGKGRSAKEIAIAFLFKTCAYISGDPIVDFAAVLALSDGIVVVKMGRH